jgi:hypothetical protein
MRVRLWSSGLSRAGGSRWYRSIGHSRNEVVEQLMLPKALKGNVRHSLEETRKRCILVGHEAQLQDEVRVNTLLLRHEISNDRLPALWYSIQPELDESDVTPRFVGHKWAVAGSSKLLASSIPSSKATLSLDVADTEICHEVSVCVSIGLANLAFCLPDASSLESLLEISQARWTVIVPQDSTNTLAISQSKMLNCGDSR